MTGVILEGVNLLLCALALVPMADANLATTLLLLFLIVGGLGSSIAVVCALVGLVKFRLSVFYGSSPSCFPAKINPPVRFAVFTISVGTRGLRCECVCFV